MKKKNLAISTVISTAVLGLSAAGAMAHLEPKSGEATEKCYGVAKAGKNDCASKANKHGCAGMGKVDLDANEWVKLPKGICEKLTGGSLSAASEKSKSEPEHKDDGHSH